ncbi:MAG TPA: amidohydrolase family protein [Gammaproteobacteria bacterium]|nr:amidohydrolase family protein [Gammaproteobacteria bacterium]
MKRTTFAFFACALAAFAARAETVAIVGGKVHTLGRAGTLEPATVLIRDGRIEAVGTNLKVPAGATVIDAAGKVVTPGFMDAYGRLGVQEIELEDSTTDFSMKNPRFGAAFSVADAINPRASKILVNRIEGLTRAAVVPASESFGENGLGNVISGQGVVIHLGGTREFLVRSPAAIFAVYGEEGAALAGGARGAALLVLREALADARDYGMNRAAFEQRARRDYALSRLDLEALQPLLRGEIPLVVEVHRAADIEAVLKLAREFGIRLVIAGGAEAWLVADRLAAANVPVIIDPAENLPSRFEMLGATLENAARLHAAGVMVAFATEDAANPRNIRQLAGNAVAHGMPYEAALAALTVNPARIYGVAGAYGALEAGKDADVVIWSGDPLEVTTFAEAVFVKGRPLPMRSRQTLLRDRYKELDEPMPQAYDKP